MAISDKLTTLNGIKSDIKTAINGKGGSVGDDFTTYATAISNLPSGGGSQDLIGLIQRSLTSFDIPSGTTSIGGYAFNTYTGLQSVTIPNTVTTINNRAFAGAGITSVTIPNSVTSIADYAFYQCNYLASVSIPDSITTLGNSVFYGCPLTSLTIPNTVTSIGNSCCRNCSSMTTLIIGSSVASINASSFQGCIALTSITCLATTPPTLSSSSFSNVPATCPIYVPAASVETYKAANFWSTRADYIQAIP